ncbi:MAG: hypothetical protein A3F72_03055 [Bacteroidetes bacterium RIFCSPLOWO2_12_FULL_35_15]|nr:MAG: hypothetical protein A3F72_03055 [Bacteroidetes bacterium RIFCSPLOWO2_12_FULL_35_15]
MSNDKIKKLQSMMGKHFKNKKNDQILLFQSFRQDNDVIHIATDSEWIMTTLFDLNILFQNHIEVEVAISGDVTELNKNTAVILKSQTIPLSIMSKLRDTLLDNIEKVKADKEYVPQAKEISSSIGQIINLAKIEIEMRTKL